ncbi:MAG TPA: hypothetical protein VJB92_02120 [Candidatus Paceibacterota bacterium]
MISKKMPPIISRISSEKDFASFLIFIFAILSSFHGFFEDVFHNAPSGLCKLGSTAWEPLDDNKRTLRIGIFQSQAGILMFG